MAKPLVSDELWDVIGPLLPVRRKRRSRKGGRPPVDDRAALCGIVFVLRTGIPWEYLPQEMGCGSGMTCWRRLRDWQRAGVWRRLHQVLLDRLNARGKIDWSRAVVDSTSIRALHAEGKNGPEPGGSKEKRHQAPSHDRRLRPCAGVLCGDWCQSSRHHATARTGRWRAGGARGGRGRPRRRFDRTQGDRGYDSQPHRRELRRRHTTPVLARRNTPHGSGLGVYRWVIERAESWVHQNRRLKMRYDRRDDIHEALVALSCAMICLNCLHDRFC